uniref:Pectin acetylesterase n=1 Tax=Steinernema glaseri TaxID=37863 RepID=A0A1I7YPZ5_9BILA
MDSLCNPSNASDPGPDFRAIYGAGNFEAQFQDCMYFSTSEYVYLSDACTASAVSMWLRLCDVHMRTVSFGACSPPPGRLCSDNAAFRPRWRR